MISLEHINSCTARMGRWALALVYINRTSVFIIGEGVNLEEGDIVEVGPPESAPSDAVEKRNAMRRVAYLWHYRVLPYEIAPELGKVN